MFSSNLMDGNLWLIIGLVFVLSEVFDGGLIILLPAGMSAFIVGLILRLQDSSLIPHVLSDLVWALVVWGFLALAISFIIRNVFKTKKSNKDINKY